MDEITNKKMDKKVMSLVLIAGTASYLDASLLVSLGVALPIWTKILDLTPILSGLISTLLTLMVALGQL